MHATANGRMRANSTVDCPRSRCRMTFTGTITRRWIRRAITRCRELNQTVIQSFLHHRPR
jgi:hypothetical protein